MDFDRVVVSGESFMKTVTTKGKILRLSACVFVFILLQICVIALDRLGIKEYNGVAMAFQFVICLMLVWVDYKAGMIISCILMGYSMVNMSVAVGLIPVTGQTLPLISHGGTSIILTSFNFGLILSVSRYAEGVADKKGKAAKKIIEDEDTLLETDEIYSNVGMA